MLLISVSLNKIYGSAWITAITDFVNAIEESIGYLISDVYYGNMIVNILVALGRIKQGRKVHETQYDTELEMIDGETFNLIKGKFEDLKSTLDVDMSVQEYMYIFTFLISTGIAAFDNKMVLARYYSGVEHISEFFCNELISEIEKSVKIRINRGTDLYRFFLLHINSLINRLKYHIMINNILKQSIINDYPGYYNLLRKGFNKILSLYPIAKMISDDEICFLVPYVHAMIEESKAKPRIVIVCIEGIGTSHIIETQIKKLFPWIEIVASVPKSKLRQFDFSGIDYIITTISVAASVNVPSIIVSPLLSESDIGNINKIIKR